MNTSGTGTVFTIGYWVVLALTIMCAAQLLGQLGPRLRAPRPAALALLAVVAVPSLIELGWHGIYTALYRAPDQIKDHHEYWRLLTGSIVQDGGLEGTIFNLLVLFVIGTLAVYAWGPGRTIGLFVVGVIGFNLAATYAFASPGGGNSAATIFLATTMVALAAVRQRTVPALAAATVVVVAGAVLLAVNDAHGIPILAGLAIGAALALVGQDRAGNPRRA
jgi:membrane associated rhomboid family serine protease